MAVSKQAVFNDEKAGAVYRSLVEFARSVARDVPPARRRDTRELDRWLAGMWGQEPFVAGIVASVVKLHSSRGWQLIGGRNTVRRVTNRLHSVESGEGWREFVSRLVLSYLTSQMPVVEMGREISPYIDNRTGEWVLFPVETMWSVDPTITRLTGEPMRPLQIGREKLGPMDYFMVRSLPDNRTDMMGASIPPIWLCLKFIMFLAALEDHDRTNLDPSFVNGLLSVSGMTEEQFAEAMANRVAAGNDPSGGNSSEIVALVSDDIPINMDFLALSRLPEGFDYEQRVLWAITAISMAFGFPSEEWIGSHASTLLGQSGAEVEAGLRRASAKGEGDFVRRFQEQLQKHVIPSTIHFEFFERDPISEIGDVELMRAKSQYWIELFHARNALNETLGSREQFIQAMIADDVLPSGWEDMMDDQLTMTDMGIPVMERSIMRDKAMSSPRVRDGIEHLARTRPHEPVVQYRWFELDGIPKESVVTLWDEAGGVLKPRAWTGWGPGVPVARKRSDPDIRTEEKGDGPDTNQGQGSDAPREQTVWVAQHGGGPGQGDREDGGEGGERPEIPSEGLEATADLLQPQDPPVPAEEEGVHPGQALPVREHGDPAPRDPAPAQQSPGLPGEIPGSDQAGETDRTDPPQ